MNKKALFLTLALLSIGLPTVAFAATLASMAAAIAGQVIIVGEWIVVIMWVVTGVLFLTTSGDPSKLKLARNSLFAAIGGTIIVIIASGGSRVLDFIASSFGL